MQYANYNIWANNLVIESMLQLPLNKIDKLMTSSFPTIRATVSHTWSAEDIWLQRLMKSETILWAESIFKGSFEDACINWQLSSKGLERFMNVQNDGSLNSILNYPDRQNQPHETPVYQILLHVFNHSTYHRGQLITMLRQTMEAKIPQTDFIVFARLQNQAG